MALVILAGKVGATTQLTRRTACVGKKRGVLPGFGVAVAIAHVCVSFFFFRSGHHRSCLFFLLLERCDRYFLGYIPKICMKSLALEGEACAAWQIPGFGLCKRLTVF